ncbi:head decoration protein [Synechococcus phage S-CBS2]|uniref:head decoration protein n=1 Tax=Synechococcus phage S-CBS2 TaxID=753084 RepID=UPI000207840C|nr:head decoration protein [Synechococcus phage S-CBS2]ADF42407.1 head decoration protein [Synechococcus phage S-CBS2]
MSNAIRIKKRAAGGAAGAPSALRSSELAFNEQDLTLYYGSGDDGSANATSIIAIAGAGAYVSLGTTQTVSGDKTFTGSVDLTGATATAATQATGTNNTTIATTAFVADAISGVYVDPLTTDGDIVVRSGGSTTRLGIGSAGQVLTVVGGIPAWQDTANAGTLNIAADGAFSGSVDLDTQTLSIVGGTGLTTSGSGQTITVDLDDTAVTPNSYGAAGSVATFTVDQQGRLTAAGTTAISITSSQVSDLGTTLGDYVSKTATGTESMVGSLTIGGNLTVNGTTTTINTQEVLVEDKNIVLGNVTTPTDVTADGGGITLLGATNKTINWVDATDAWTLSEHVNIAATKEYRMNGTAVLAYNGATRVLDNVEIDGGTF